MDNNLYKVENNLRSIAKRHKSVKYSVGLAILFLMLGTSAFSEDVMTNEQIASSKENLRNSIGSLQSKINQAKAENEKELTGLRLELIQLMEQGDQVVKSPWASWQFGANYMYSKWNGTYKGKGDKAEKYPFEGVFERDTNLFNRYIPTTSENYGLLSKSNNPRSAASNSRANVDNYGIASNITVLEPPVETEVNAGINPKNVNKVPLNINAKAANAVTLPDTVKFSPISPEKLDIDTPVINIKDITLVNLWNWHTPPGSQYPYDHGNKTISSGYTYNLNTDYNAGSGITGYNKVKTFSSSEVLKTSQGIDYQKVPNFNTPTGGMEDYTYGAIFEFLKGEYTIDGLTLEVDEVKDRNGIPIHGTRAISTDAYGNLKVHNKSNIKLSADGAVGFATDEDPGSASDLHQMTNEKEGLIYATGKKNAAFILVKEQPNPSPTYEHINKGKIIMDGDESYAFAFSKTTGIQPNMFISHNINDGEIVMAGKDNYGFAFGKDRDYKVADSYINNGLNGSISMLGDNSMAIVTQSDMSYAKQ